MIQFQRNIHNMTVDAVNVTRKSIEFSLFIKKILISSKKKHTSLLTEPNCFSQEEFDEDFCTLYT